MTHRANSAGHRYSTVRPTTGHRISHTETPFCEIDRVGYCHNPSHSHTGPVRKAHRWLLRRKV